MVHNFNIRYIFCMEIGKVSLHDYFNFVYYQNYDEIINKLLNTCIILVGVGRIYSIQGEVVKRGKGYFQNSGEVAKRWELKNSGGGGFGPYDVYKYNHIHYLLY